MKIAVACYTFVGRCSGCPSPWTIKVERLAFLAFSTIRIVLTVTGQLTVLVKPEVNIYGTHETQFLLLNSSTKVPSLSLRAD